MSFWVFFTRKILPGVSRFIGSDVPSRILRKLLDQKIITMPKEFLRQYYVSYFWAISMSFWVFFTRKILPGVPNVALSNAPSRILSKRLDQKISSGGLATHSYSRFSSPRTVLWSGSYGGGVYTIRVGSVRHTSHSKEPSNFGCIPLGVL
jgi:hypothetical protein